MTIEVKTLEELFEQLGNFDGACRICVDHMDKRVFMSAEHQPLDLPSGCNWHYLFSDELECHVWDELPFSDLMVSIEMDDIELNNDEASYRNFFGSKKSAIEFVQDLEAINCDSEQVDYFNGVKEKVLTSLNNSKSLFLEEDLFNLQIVA